MSPADKLRLYEIADELDQFSIDNGPNGEDRPFQAEARELRAIARNESGNSEGLVLRENSPYYPRSGDFRDAPWEPR